LPSLIKSYYNRPVGVQRSLCYDANSVNDDRYTKYAMATRVTNNELDVTYT
jgi:hypothetical protein